MTPIKLMVALPTVLAFLVTAVADDADEQVVCEITSLEWDFEQAVLKGDLAFFNRVLAPDFTHTTQTGKFRDRAEWLANHKPGQSNYDALHTSDLTIRVYDKTAIVTATIKPQGRDSQGNPIEGHYRYLRVWVKHGRDWQVAAFQSTRVSDTVRGSKP